MISWCVKIFQIISYIYNELSDEDYPPPHVQFPLLSI